MGTYFVGWPTMSNVTQGCSSPSLKGKSVDDFNPKILVIDIETMAAQAYVWRLFKENVGLEQIIDPGGVICFGYQWLGDPKIGFMSDWEHGHDAMIEKAYELLSEADAVVGFNHKKFDIPHLWTEFITAGYKSPPPIQTNIDLLQVAKSKFRFLSNRLGFIGPHLQVGAKIKHEGFELWVKVKAGDKVARRKMEKYCKQDVRMTGNLYNKMAPYITNHPHMGSKGKCGACGSSKAQKRGYRYTATMRIARLRCENGHWYDGKRERMI